MFELDEARVISCIKENGSKRVLLQLPDGLKIKSGELVKKIEKETGAEVLMWFGSNFGACDLPVGAKALNVDLIVGFGHNTYIKEVSW